MIPIAIIALSRPVPSMAIITIANSMLGSENITSTPLITILSIHPPKYPDKIPKIEPIKTPIITAIKPTVNETLDPYMILDRISLPNSSVPSILTVLSFQKPGCNLSFKDCEYGSKGENYIC